MAIAVPGVPVPAAFIVGLEQEATPCPIGQVERDGNRAVAPDAEPGDLGGLQDECGVGFSVEIEEAHGFRPFPIAGQAPVEGCRIGRSAHVAGPIGRRIRLDIVETGDAHLGVAIVDGLRQARIRERIEVENAFARTRQGHHLAIGQATGVGPLGRRGVEHGDVLEAAHLGGIAAVIRGRAEPRPHKGVAALLLAILIGTGVAEGQGIAHVVAADAAFEYLQVQLSTQVTGRGQLGEQHPAIAIGRSIGSRRQGKPAIAVGTVQGNGVAHLESTGPRRRLDKLDAYLIGRCIRRTIDADGHPRVLLELRVQREEDRIDRRRSRAAQRVLEERFGGGDPGGIKTLTHHSAEAVSRVVEMGKEAVGRGPGHSRKRQRINLEAHLIRKGLIHRRIIAVAEAQFDLRVAPILG